MAVSRRKDRGGRWQFVIDLPAGADGKRHQVRRLLPASVRTKREAEEEERTYLSEHAVMPSTAPRDLTVAQYLDQWLAVYAKVQVKTSTYTRYNELVKIHIKPSIGRIVLTKLRPLDVERCYATARESVSERTTLHVHRCLRGALEQAVRWQILRENPAARATAPRPAKPETITPTLVQLQRLLDIGDATPFGRVFWLAAYTGMRQGELLALTWENVDFDETQLKVRATARHEKGRGVVMGTPKTEKSRRTVPLVADAWQLLQEQRRAQNLQKMRERLDYRDQGLVFADPLGRPLQGSYVSRVWRELCRKEGLDGIRFHDLRHATATLLLQAGVPMKVVSELLGHTTMATTADIYTDVIPAVKVEAVEKLGLMLRRHAQ